MLKRDTYFPVTGLDHGISEYIWFSSGVFCVIIQVVFHRSYDPEMVEGMPPSVGEEPKTCLLICHTEWLKLCQYIDDAFLCSDEKPLTKTYSWVGGLFFLRGNNMQTINTFKERTTNLETKHE